MYVCMYVAYARSNRPTDRDAIFTGPISILRECVFLDKKNSKIQFKKKQIQINLKNFYCTTFYLSDQGTPMGTGVG